MGESKRGVVDTIIFGAIISVLFLNLFMVESGGENGAEEVNDGLSEVERWMFLNLIHGLFERVAPDHDLEVFLREKLYRLSYRGVGAGVCRVYVCDDTPGSGVVLAFDFNYKKRFLTGSYLKNVNDIKAWIEAFTIAGHW